MSTMFFIQSIIVLLRILIDARVGDIGLDMFGDVGLAALAFGLHPEPTSPPIDVVLMVMAVVSAAASVQTGSGLDYTIKITACVLHHNPRYITFVTPAITYLFIVLAGTGYVAYSVLPVTTEVNRRNGIRPPCLLAMAVIVSQSVIVASLIAAAVIACVTYLEPQYVTMADVLKVTAPLTTPDIGLVCVSVSKLGKELKDGPHYQKLPAKSEYAKAREKDPTEHISLTVSSQAKLLVGIFLAAALLMVVMDAVPELRPTLQTEEELKLMDIAHTIEIITLSAVALIILLCKPDGNAITRGSVFHTGMRAVIVVFGVVWLGDTLMHGHLAEVKDTVSHLIETALWTFVAVLFVLPVLVNSQGATAATLFPIAISLNVPAPVIIGMFVVVSGYLFIPDYGPIIAAIDFNSTGSTKIDKYTFNHSFMIPGLLSLISNLIFGSTFTEALPRA